MNNDSGYWPPADSFVRDMLARSVGLRNAADFTTLHMIALARNDAITRDDMARAYGQYLVLPDVDWAAVNQAIVSRWPRGLKYIKRQAYKVQQS